MSLSAHMPIKLKWTGEAVEGEVGHVARRFLPVTANGDCLKHVQGLWYHPHYRTAFEIRGDRVHIGVGPAAQTGTLSPLGGAACWWSAGRPVVKTLLPLFPRLQRGSHRQPQPDADLPPQHRRPRLTLSLRCRF